MAEVHTFDLINITPTQINNASLSKRILLDVGTEGDGVQASLYATPEQVVEMGVDIGSTTNALIRSKPSETKKMAYSVVTLDDYGHFQNVGSMTFDTTPTSAPGGVGSLIWDDGFGTLTLTLKGGNVTQELCQGGVQMCYNSSGSVSLAKGNVVQIVGSQGNRLAIAKAQANAESTSIHTFGFVAETIGTLSEGFVINSGIVKGLDTTQDSHGNALSAGDTLFLSPTIAGGFTKIKPTAPNHLIVIGFVVSVHASTGSIFTKIDNGYELGELHNVSAPGEGVAFLVRNESTDIWEEKNPTQAREIINSGITVNTITGSTYTIAASDNHNTLLMSNGGIQTVTIPTNLDVPLPDGSTITFVQIGAGQVQFVAASGVTLSVRGYGNATAGQYAVACIIKISTNHWVLTGDITLI